MAKFRIERLEDRIVPSSLCSFDCGSNKSGKSNKSAKCGSSKKDGSSKKCGSSKKDGSSKKCGSSKKHGSSKKCASGKKGNNGYGNGGRDGSPNGKQDRTR